jgi:hypothetical protein
MMIFLLLLIVVGKFCHGAAAKLHRGFKNQPHDKFTHDNLLALE